jgi:hypothetical protein
MPKVDETTIIQFNLKWFIGMIVSLLMAFSGFYYTVQKPSNEGIKSHMDELMAQEHKYQDLKFEKLDDMNTTLTHLQTTVDALKKRNDDLDALRNRVASTNTGGEL